MLHIIVRRCIVFPLIIMSGCTFTHRLNVEPETDSLPIITKSPAYAGIYYSPQFINQEYTRKSGSHIYVAPIGAASAHLFDELFPRAFEKTTHVSGLSSDELTAKGVDVAIAPTLEHFDFILGLDADSDRYSVVYRMTLYTNRGVPVASWIVSGNKEGHAFSIGGVIEDDMTDAADNFLTTFNREADPVLTAIAKNEKEEVSSIDPRDINVSARIGKIPGLDPQQDALLKHSGIVVIDIEARNVTERNLVVHASSMRLQTKDGQQIEPMTVSSVLRVLDQTSHTSEIVGELAGLPFALLSMYVEEQSNESKRELQFNTGSHALFEDRALEKGKTDSGIVLFRLPDNAINVEGAKLLVWVIDPETTEGTQIEVNIATAQ